MDTTLLVTCLVAAVLGLHLLGALLRWKPIVDPDTSLWLVWPQAAFRRLFEPAALRVFTIVYCTAFIAAGPAIAILYR